jgi:hypothetical protein
MRPKLHGMQALRCPDLEHAAEKESSFLTLPSQATGLLLRCLFGCRSQISNGPVE